MARHARDHHADIFIPAVILMVIAAFTVGDIVRPAATSGLSETAMVARHTATTQAVAGIAATGARAQTAQTLAATAAKLKATPVPTVDWHAPSETKAYPSITAHPKLRIEVSIAAQRVYLYDGSRLLYTMFASTGTDNSTPKGHYKIEAERGDYFYNPNERLGAHYYTSFHQHGTYLFHTVPTDAKGHYIASEAAKLGKAPGSHGCVRLTIPDAKWLMGHVKTGTAVHIY
ncbi:L,D-transpeptidase [Lacticaseibacillus nasuensis]|uniref:L,D-TPase catalytic domain-containing protein n=2 Tax=Lacticaseibacillus TaxID=2759736 RepID=A0A0R1JPA8_9LACO|nr:L,D-transpeptidase [Lacticaseibacillus nasuensis]KRK70180.1 hypothetical protein FD02_GL000636 [Lacticaseibacillus nasuensis JCM 17158]